MAKSTLSPPSSPPPPQLPAESHSPQEDSSSSDEDVDGVEQFVANGSPAGTNSVSGDAAESTTSYVYLRSLIQELIDEHPFVGWHTVDDLISQIGDSSRLRRFEAEAKALRIEEFKLLARKCDLKAEVFRFLAQVMLDDDDDDQ